MNVNHKGYIGQLKVALDLAMKGYHVFTPTSDYSPVDLIAMNSAGVVSRIQVKYRTVNANTKDVITVVMASVVQGRRVLIDKSLIDGWAVYCPEVEAIIYFSKNQLEDQVSSFSFRLKQSGNANRGPLYSEFLDESVLFS